MIKSLSKVKFLNISEKEDKLLTL